MTLPESNPTGLSLGILTPASPVDLSGVWRIRT